MTGRQRYRLRTFGECSLLKDMLIQYVTTLIPSSNFCIIVKWYLSAYIPGLGGHHRRPRCLEESWVKIQLASVSHSVWLVTVLLVSVLRQFGLAVLGVNADRTCYSVHHYDPLYEADKFISFQGIALNFNQCGPKNLTNLV